MKCPRCGNECETGLEFCNICGQNLVSETEVHNKGKSRKKLFAIIGGAAAVIVVIAVMIIMNFNTVYGKLIKTFGSDEAYFKYVEMKEFREYSAILSDYYDSAILKELQNSTSTEANIRLNVSDAAASMMANLTDNGEDLSWLNEIALGMNTNIKDGLYSADVKLNVSDKDIITLSEIFDIQAGELFIQAPELTDKVMYQKLFDEELMDSYGLSSGGYEYIKELDRCISKIKDVAPEKSEFNDLILKYTKIAIDNIDKISKSKDKLTVSEISQNCTVLEITIDEETIANIICQVLTEAKEDEKLKEIITSAQDEFAQEGSDEDWYGMFVQNIDNALNELDTSKEQSDLSEEIIVIKDYINGSDNIIGRSFIIPGGKEIFFVTVKNGKDYATQLQAGTLNITGSGTESDSKKNGTYSLEIEDQKCLGWEIEDFDYDRLKKGYLNGTIRLNINDAIANAGLDDSSQALLSMLNPSFELKFNTSEDTSLIDINLLSNNTLFAGLTVECRKSSGSSIQKPESNLIDLNNYEELEELIASINFDTVIQNLKETNVPDELIGMLEMGINSMYDIY